MTIPDILTGRAVERFAIGEHGFCSLAFNGGYSLTLESLLRYVGRTGVFISAADHMQPFGLSSPYDAEKEIRGRIEGRVIRYVDLTSDTGDLTLGIDEGRIEIICTSAGYEAYQLHGPENLTLVARGGCGDITTHNS